MEKLHPGVKWLFRLNAYIVLIILSSLSIIPLASVGFELLKNSIPHLFRNILILFFLVMIFVIVIAEICARLAYKNWGYELTNSELKIEKGAKNPKLENVGNLSLQQIIKIAKMKIDHLNSTQIKKASNEVMGTCQQMGVTIEGRKASEIIKEVNEGKHDSLFEEK